MLVVFVICVMIAHVICFVSNTILLTQCDFKAPYKAEFLRIGAYFIPTGTVLMTFISNESLGEVSK
jgi:hypothetical protein